jgi:hypothetical protein
MIHQLNKLGLVPVRDYVCAPDEGCAVSLNPKGFDSPRAIGFRQDRPSETAGVTEANVYTMAQLDNYRAGAPYGSRSSSWVDFPTQNRGRDINQTYAINNGQIQYYVDDSTKAPYYSPVFDMPSVAPLVDYVDPMGTWKPHYPYTIFCPQKYSCLSSINDSSFQREDLMARQQAVNNQRRSEPFFNFY